MTIRPENWSNSGRTTSPCGPRTEIEAGDQQGEEEERFRGEEQPHTQPVAAGVFKICWKIYFAGVVMIICGVAGIVAMFNCGYSHQ